MNTMIGQVKQPSTTTKIIAILVMIGSLVIGTYSWGWLGFCLSLSVIFLMIQAQRKVGHIISVCLQMIAFATLPLCVALSLSFIYILYIVGSRLSWRLEMFLETYDQKR